MIGVILCGGEARSFYPSIMPKSLLEIKDGVTVLDEQLKLFSKHNFKRVILLAGHQTGGDKILKHAAGVRRKYNLQIDAILEDIPKGTLIAVREGMRTVNEDVMLCNGDVLTDINLSKMMNKFKRDGKLATMLIVKIRSHYGVIETDNKYITGFVEKPYLDYYINGGYYCFKHELLSHLEGYDKGDLGKEVFPKLASMKQLTYYKEKNPYWKSMDTYRDLREVRETYGR
jgi:NDP-sugar pyrophosphorylase family protein